LNMDVFWKLVYIIIFLYITIIIPASIIAYESEGTNKEICCSIFWKVGITFIVEMVLL